ncbi:MAG: hypothetical protein NW206_19990 [Hyphomonadaceae bacterium]|nr:hypothetical protein [Hyphomonadaceae bacterium]
MPTEPPIVCRCASCNVPLPGQSGPYCRACLAVAWEIQRGREADLLEALAESLALAARAHRERCLKPTERELLTALARETMQSVKAWELA